jgi:hypothetical protein
MEINYKIYKISSELTDKIYIGSTMNLLHKRFYQHSNDKNRTVYKKLIILGDAKIELICDKIKTKELSRILEGEMIKMYKDVCINNRLAGRTYKESRKYYNQSEKGKEKHKQDAKKYRDKIKGLQLSI